MLTGRSIREACGILSWGRYDLQRRTALPLVYVDLLMKSTGVLDPTKADEIVLKDAFHRAGLALDAAGAWVRIQGRP